MWGPGYRLCTPLPRALLSPLRVVLLRFVYVSLTSLALFLNHRAILLTSVPGVLPFVEFPDFGDIFCFLFCFFQ